MRLRILLCIMVPHVYLNIYDKAWHVTGNKRYCKMSEYRVIKTRQMNEDFQKIMQKIERFDYSLTLKNSTYTIHYDNLHNGGSNIISYFIE